MHRLGKTVFGAIVLCAGWLLFNACTEKAKKRIDHVLFIGNSYTYRNKGVDRHLYDLLKNSGDSSKFVTRAAKGKYHLYSHWKDEETKAIFNQHNWDRVVLQEYSAGPLREEKKFYDYTKKWAREIRRRNPKAEIFLYSTWGYKRLPGMTDSLYANYQKAAKKINAKIVPVGKLWESVRAKINLYDGDGAHPNRKGTFLTACLFYEYMEKKDVRKTPNKDQFLPKKTQKYLKELVHEFVATYELDRQKDPVIKS